MFHKVVKVKPGFLKSSFLSTLCTLEISFLSDVRLVKTFFHSLGCHFVLLMVFFGLQKVFRFMRPHLLSVDHGVCTIGALFRKLC